MTIATPRAVAAPQVLPGIQTPSATPSAPAVTLRSKSGATIPFLTQFWLFATPVAYPSSLVPERWRALYGLNPLAGVVEGFRWALLGKAEGPGPLLTVSVVVVVVELCELLGVVAVGGVWAPARAPAASVATIAALPCLEITEILTFPFRI